MKLDTLSFMATQEKPTPIVGVGKPKQYEENGFVSYRQISLSAEPQPG